MPMRCVHEMQYLQSMHQHHRLPTRTTRMRRTRRLPEWGVHRQPYIGIVPAVLGQEPGCRVSMSASMKAYARVVRTASPPARFAR